MKRSPVAPFICTVSVALAAQSACTGGAAKGRGPASVAPAVIVIPEAKTDSPADFGAEVRRLCDLLPHRDEPMISPERRGFEETLDRLRTDPERAREAIRAALESTPREQAERRSFLSSLSRELTGGTEDPARRTAAAANSRPSSR